MPKYHPSWDAYNYISTSSTTIGNWYTPAEAERYYSEKERYYREWEMMQHRLRMDQMMPPPAYEINEREVSRLALGPAPKKKEETPLDWLHARVNEVCDDALTAVA